VNFLFGTGQQKESHQKEPDFVEAIVLSPCFYSVTLCMNFPSSSARQASTEIYRLLPAAISSTLT
jgi:hypothetical protein